MKTDSNYDYSKSRHLSDDQLYDLAYKECNWILFTDKEAEARKHITFCEICRKTFEAYLGLMSVISSDFTGSPAQSDSYEQVSSDNAALDRMILLVAAYTLSAMDICNKVRLLSSVGTFMNFVPVSSSKQGAYRSSSMCETVKLETVDSEYSSIIYDPDEESLSIELDADLFGSSEDIFLIAELLFEDGSTQKQTIIFDELSESYLTRFEEIAPDMTFTLTITKIKENEK